MYVPMRVLVGLNQCPVCVAVRSAARQFLSCGVRVLLRRLAFEMLSVATSLTRSTPPLTWPAPCDQWQCPFAAEPAC